MSGIGYFSMKMHFAFLPSLAGSYYESDFGYYSFIYYFLISFLAYFLPYFLSTFIPFFVVVSSYLMRPFSSSSFNIGGMNGL
jgi:hypothetical protein